MAILGMDFLMTNSIDVLFSKGSLRIKDEFITCFTNKGDSSCCRISIAETVDIPHDSEMLIKGMPCGPVIFNEVGLVETNKSFIEKTGLLLARVVVQPNSNIIPLRVANFSTEPVKVYKNTIVGTFEPVDIETFEVSTVSRVNCAEIKTEVGIPDHLKCVFEKSSKDLDNIEVKKLKEFYVLIKMFFQNLHLILGILKLLTIKERGCRERDTRHGIKGHHRTFK
ncbi:TSR1 [Mytilus coruscus]|uniref:TSR1 n=1 Tax=Mytilus coruscus TaxID=42192 RepID=A0A6J8C0S5_MYTCO|nr:TSR1 [Mytilus coruscus]